MSIIAIFIFTSFYRSICKLSINFNSNFEMAEEYTTLNEEKLTQLIRKIFQEEFKKQEAHITNIISSNFNNNGRNQEIARANIRAKERSDRPEIQH